MKEKNEILIRPTLIDEIIEYIEDCELMIDSEWGGGCGNVPYLIETGKMPEIYFELLNYARTHKQ